MPGPTDYCCSNQNRLCSKWGERLTSFIIVLEVCSPSFSSFMLELEGTFRSTLSLSLRMFSSTFIVI